MPGEITMDDYGPRGSLPKATTELAERLRRLPGIGSRNAMLGAIQISRDDNDRWDRLTDAIREANARARRCGECHGVADAETCEICRSPGRRKDLICVVERPGDMEVVEAIGYYSGVYHVLHGRLEPLRGIGPDALTMRSLLERVESLRGDPMAELIIATSNTLEGQATADYIRRAVEREPGEVRISTLRKGIADKAALEFADPMTVTHAVVNRSDGEADFPGETP